MSIWKKPNATLDATLDDKSIALNGSGELEVKGMSNASNNFILYKKVDGTVGWKAEISSLNLDNTSINVSTGSKLQVVGFEGASTNYFPYKLANGNLAWKLFSLAHNNTTSKDGGTTGEYYHLTSLEYAALHTHANKTLLDTYSQTEVNLASAVSLKHSHINKALLDTLTGATTGILHSNGTTIDGITTLPLSTGVIGTDPSLTDNGDSTVTVSSAVFNVYSTTDFSGELFPYTVPQATFTLTANVEEYISVRYNNGTPVYTKESTDTVINYSSILPSFVVWRIGTICHSLSTYCFGLGLPNKLQSAFYHTNLYSRSADGGLVIKETSAPAYRTITVTGGTVYSGAIAITVNPFTSASDNMTFVKHVTATWTYIANQRFYENLNYDNGTDLVNLTDGQYGVRWFYRSVGDVKQLFYVCGSATYEKLRDAESEQPRTDLPEILKKHCILIGRAIIIKGADSGSVNSNFDLVYLRGYSLNHNDTSNIQGGSTNAYYHLTSSEHTNATRSATGSLTGLLSSTDWTTFNNKEPALTKGNLTAGSTKIAVSGSSTNSVIGTGVVIDVQEINLNLANMGGTLGVTHGGSGTTTAFTPGSIVFATSSGRYTEDNSNLFWDDSSNFLGIGTNTPAFDLEVVTLDGGIRGIASTQHNNGVDGAYLNFRKSRGSLATPTNISDGDTIGRLAGFGYYGGAYTECVAIDFKVNGTLGSGRVPSEIDFLTATDANPSVLTTRMKILSDGSIVFGSYDAGNYGQFDSDGAYLAFGNATTWNDLPPIPIAQIIPGGGNAPTKSTFKGGVQQYTFAVNDYASGAYEVTHTYKPGSTFSPHIHWATGGTNTTTRFVRWEFEYTISNSDFEAPFTSSFGNTVVLEIEVEIPANTGTSAHIVTPFSTILGTHITHGAYIVYRVRRIAATGGTAPSSNPFALALGIHIEQDRLGTIVVPY